MSDYFYFQPRGSRHGGRPMQAKVLDYILLCLEEGFSPTVQQVRVHVGCARKESARACLLRMHAAGRLPPGFDTREILAKRATTTESLPCS